MVFSSLIFLFVFLPIFLLVYFVIPRKFKNIVLFLASLIFYAWGEPVYIIIMVFSTVTDYTAGRVIDKYRHKKSIPKIALIASIIINLSLLGFFKYMDFFITNINDVFASNIGLLKIALPIGISFYTFQTMSYVIDVYRGSVKVQKNIISFGAYVAMFPQLIAGPIVTYGDVEKEIDNRKETVDDFSQGVKIFIEGLGKKVLIANNIGLLWEGVKGTPFSEISLLGSWLGIIAFALQIYFDFSGYSDMAIGLGRMIGFRFPYNFNFPYCSKSATEFWRRWHITLGNWFREYVYIPLGGNRKGKLKFYRNIFIVWFLTGFWHGAQWNFIVWGLFFCMLIIIERNYLIERLKKLPSFISRVYFLIIILIGWVLFTFDRLGDAVKYLKIMFGLGNTALVNDAALYGLSNYFVYLIIGIIFSTPLVRKLKIKVSSTVLYIIYMVILVVSTAYLVDSTFNPFLYFRF